MRLFPARGKYKSDPQGSCKQAVASQARPVYLSRMVPEICPIGERALLYEVMAPALAGLGENWRDWPAALAGAESPSLSSPEFHEGFGRWLAISEGQERGDLCRGGDTEPGADDRKALYPVQITVEGLCPAETYSRGGPAGGLRIGRAPTPFGSGAWLIGPDGLIALGFIDERPSSSSAAGHTERDEEAAFADLLRRFGSISVRRDDQAAGRLARAAFEDRQSVPLCLFGTPFRRGIWRTLLELNVAKTATYAQVAAFAGAPGASRAAGASIGANPIGWFIPCHRVLAATGRLHNYHWGMARKRAMLVYEQACSRARVPTDVRARPSEMS